MITPKLESPLELFFAFPSQGKPYRTSKAQATSILNSSAISQPGIAATRAGTEPLYYYCDICKLRVTRLAPFMTN